MGAWIDQVARTLAAGQSRRQALRTLGAVTLGAVFSGVRPSEASADEDCKGTGKACKKNEQCCSGNCTPQSTSKSTAKSDSICCPAGQVQHNGACCSLDPAACSGKTCGT